MKKSALLCMVIYNLLITFPAVLPNKLPEEETEPAITVSKIENETSSGFVQALIASLSMIIVSELGDKTFFIAAIMAMRHPRAIVFFGAISALIFMTVLSAGFGWVATVVPRAYTYYVSAALFALFGIKMLRDGWKMDPNEGQEELEEVQQDLRKRDDQFEKEAVLTLVDQEMGGRAANAGSRRRAWGVVARIFMQAASMTFLAEWGDRSQLATVILGAREDVWGVILGGIVGHSICTGLAVLGGRIVAQRISVRTVTLIGGVVFLVFAISALFIDPNDT
ncbi:putative divalent cation/proton antiporter TMEM165 isoform X2 [Arctopsyche grandis]|uniref:putative divalent cation/proton antiporter TMEM165 isoform X2 n=1 Tax=Arctopsyche grandis TaxID=121162 RepID=UPI00406D8319